MANVVKNNYTDNLTAGENRTRVNGAGMVLKLFVNNFASTPASVHADFTECTATGYAAQSVTGDWGAVSSPTSGTYQWVGSVHTFTTTDVLPINVYGWWIEDGANNVLYSCNHTAPLSFWSGSPVAIQITLREKSEFLI